MVLRMENARGLFSSTRFLKRRAKASQQRTESSAGLGRPRSLLAERIRQHDAALGDLLLTLTHLPTFGARIVKPAALWLILRFL